MRNELFLKHFTAGAVVNKFRIIKYGALPAVAVQASAASDALMGVSDGLGANAVGIGFDAIKGGIAKVVYGGPVALGDPLTSDAEGRAVKAAAGDRIIGFAELPGVLGDEGSVSIQLGFA